MKFPLNQLKLDPEYLTSIEDKFENDLLAKYEVFKRHSSVLVTAFNDDKEKYSSIEHIPEDILQRYSICFELLLDINKNLCSFLKRQVNKNTKDMDLIELNADEDSFINTIALRKRKKLHDKIEYFITIQGLYNTIIRVLDK